MNETNEFVGGAEVEQRKAGTLPDGFYYLTADIKNPRSDRRSNQTNSLQVWPTGTRVFLRNPHEFQYWGVVEWRDGTISYFGPEQEDKADRKTYNQANEVILHLTPAKRTLGQFFVKASSIRPVEAIARLLDSGTITLEDLDKLDQEAYSESDENYKSLCDRHEI
jgi:hypothetical protein